MLKPEVRTSEKVWVFVDSPPIYHPEPLPPAVYGFDRMPRKPSMPVCDWLSESWCIIFTHAAASK